jgi:hypothetical protein
MSLNLAQNLSLPLEAVTWVISYVAKRGAGKTYDAAVQAEEMLRNNIPIVVVDGMSIWWGLRVGADGKSPGLPVVVFGGEHADLPLTESRIPEITRAIVDSNISCVLDVGGLSKYAARKIVASFLTELYQVNRASRHVFIEEADLWAPQRPIGNEEAVCLSAVDNFVRRGGNHNLGCTLITQRSAVLNKNVLTQSDCLVILRLLAPVDKAAVQAWVEEQTDKDRAVLKEWYDSLKSLENGEAWVWHPEKPEIFIRTKYRARITFHATREFIRSPQAAKVVLMDVAAFVSKFRTVFADSPTTGKDAGLGVQDYERLQSKLGELEKNVREVEAAKQALKERVSDLESQLSQADLLIENAQADAEALRELRQVFGKLLPQPQTYSKQAALSTLELEAAETKVLYTSETQVVKVSALDGWPGKVVQVMLKDLAGKEAKAGEIASALEEHGWKTDSHLGRFAANTLAPMIASGLLVKGGTERNALYRLPGKIVYEEGR